MREAEARALVAALVAAFPRQVLEKPSVDLYATAIGALESSAAAAQAVDAIIRSSHVFPSVAAIRIAYREARRRELEAEAHAQRARELEAAEPTPRELPPGAREYLAGLQLRTMSEKEKLGAERMAALPPAGRGKCADCEIEAELAKLGRQTVCVRCAASRIRVGLALEASAA